MLKEFADGWGIVLATALAVACLPATGWAQSEASEIAEDVPASAAVHWRARVRYGASLRTGGQSDSGPGASYSGETYNDVALEGAVWPTRMLGVSASAQREAFLLTGSAGTLGGLSVWRAALGPSARLLWRALSLEATVGYQLAQLPGLSSTLTPSVVVASRHALWAAARVHWALPARFFVEARAGVPIALSTAVPGGTAASSSGVAAGVSLGWQAWTWGAVAVRALVDYELVWDRLAWQDASGGALQASQRLHRVGFALELAGVDAAPERVRVGTLQVRVVDSRSGKTIPGASAGWGAESTQTQAASDGWVRLEGVSAGPVDVRAQAPDYLPGMVSTSVTAGRVVSVEVPLDGKPPPSGGLVIQVVDRKSKAPLPGATVQLLAQRLETNAEGQVEVSELLPGAVSLAVSLAGYQSGDEAGTVVAGKMSSVVIELTEAKKRVPATITGIVRSTRKGKPLRATLEIRQAKLKLEASANGAFSFQVPGGTYSIIISAPGHLKQSKWVTVQEGAQAIFNVDLHPSK